MIYDEIDENLCKHVSDFLITPEVYNPLHHRSVHAICEVLLLQDQRKFRTGVK